MINIPDNIKELLENAEAKALATVSSEFPHVVPVSTLFVHDHTLVLVNYFMGNTIQNILANPAVSLVCWRGFDGYQIKGTVVYETEGDTFDRITLWAKEKFPNRTVQGILVLHPEEIYDISPNAKLPGERIL